MIKIPKSPFLRQAIRFVNSIKRIGKKYSFPGFAGIPIYYVIRFIIQELTKDDLTTRANSVAFNFFLSIFPAVIFLFTLIPLFPGSLDLLTLFSNSTKDIIPETAHNYLFEIIEGVVSIKRGGLLSIGFFLALIFASSGVSTLMYGFDKSYAHTFKKRGLIRHRLVAIALTTLLTLLLVSSMTLIVFSNQILSTLNLDFFDSSTNAFIFSILKWLTVIAIFYLAITLIYRYGPSMYQRIPYLNPGATLATAFSILTSLGFAAFVNNFGRYNEIYGSIGALIVILVWIQINSFIILAGFELNASIAVNRFIFKNKKSRTTPSKTGIV